MSSLSCRRVGDFSHSRPQRNPRARPHCLGARPAALPGHALRPHRRLSIPNPYPSLRYFGYPGGLLQLAFFKPYGVRPCKIKVNRMTQTSPAVAAQASRSTRDPELRVQNQESGHPQNQSQTHPEPLIQVEGLRKTYQTARGSLDLFSGLNLEVAPGEMVAIVGQSGAGKALFCTFWARLMHPPPELYTAPLPTWQVFLCGTLRPFATVKSVTSGSSIICCRSSRRLRTSPCRFWLAALSGARRWQLAANWLREVGLEDRGSHRPGELSGGEQQRVALARALVNNPRLLLADEPTGDLDEITAGRVFDLIERLHSSHGLTSILVTHNLELAARCTRALRLENGRLTPLAARPPAHLDSAGI